MASRWKAVFEALARNKDRICQAAEDVYFIVLENYDNLKRGVENMIHFVKREEGSVVKDENEQMKAETVVEETCVPKTDVPKTFVKREEGSIVKDEKEQVKAEAVVEETCVPKTDVPKADVPKTDVPKDANSGSDDDDIPFNDIFFLN